MPGVNGVNGAGGANGAPPSTLRVAVIGAGSMGQNHLRVLSDFGQNVELVALAEPVDAARQRSAARFQVPSYADYREMLETEKPDLVTVVVPTQMHYEITMYALDRGINVLVEKPIANTIEEGRAMIDLAKARGVHLAVGHLERFNPAVVELKRQIESGRLGRIFSMHARRLGPFPPRIRDVGVTLDLATHDMDVMRYLCASEVEYVFAETQRRVHQSHEDLVLGLVRFSNAVVGVVDVNWLTPTKIRELSVTGERGMFQVNYLAQDLYFYENDYEATNWDALRRVTGVSEGSMTRLKVAKAEPLRIEYENVISAIRNDASVTVTGEDGLAVLTLAHSLLTAAHTREVIPCQATVPTSPR